MIKHTIKPEFLNSGKYIEGFGIVKINEDLTASDVKALMDLGLSEVFEVLENPKKEILPKNEK